MRGVSFGSLVITNAKIYGGTSRPFFYGNIAIQWDTIVHVGKAFRAMGKKRINADGMALAPGFIDLHSHSDTTNPLLQTFLPQWVHEGGVEKMLVRVYDESVR